MIQILPEASWREFRSPSRTRGQNHTTHQALIADASGQEHKCFVKASPNGYPMPFAEALAYMIAESLDLARPKFAALLHLPISKLRTCMSLDQHWNHYPTALAFCSSTVPGKHITSKWKWLEHIRSAKAFKNNEVARIAAFDIWVENQDRHTGNFIRSGDGSYIPIDNELILYTMLWAASGFTYVHNSLRNQALQILKANGYNRFESAMIVASKQHARAITRAAPELQKFIELMIADPTQGPVVAGSILTFLNDRAGPDWLALELGQIP